MGWNICHLEKIAEIRSGWGFPNKEQGRGYGDIPFFKVSDMNHSGNELFMISANNYIDNIVVKRLRCKPAPAGTIIFPKIGAAIATNKKRILVCNSCYDNNVIGLISRPNIENKYLYYLMDSVDLIGFADFSGAMPSIRKSTLERYCIPVPPLPVQREIVRILDNFTELTARRKQYEYYRDTLFETAKDVSIFYLPDISINCDNRRKPVTSSNRTKGKYPYYGASGIVDYVSDYIFDGDYLLVSEDGANLLARSTPIAFSISGKNWVNNHAHILQFERYETRRYVEIYLNSIDLSSYVTGGAQPKLNQNNLNKIAIPLPPLAEQKRIVNFLDRFDTLCTDLTTGLPAEIAARQKQYEYYRDKLLSFKELHA